MPALFCFFKEGRGQTGTGERHERRDGAGRQGDDAFPAAGRRQGDDAYPAAGRRQGDGAFPAAGRRQGDGAFPAVTAPSYTRLPKKICLSKDFSGKGDASAREPYLGAHNALFPSSQAVKEPTSSRQGVWVCGALRLPHDLIRPPLLFPQNPPCDFCGSPESQESTCSPLTQGRL